MGEIIDKIYSPSGMLSDNGIKEYFKNGIDIFIDEKETIQFDLNSQLHVGSIDLHFRHLYRKFSSKNTVLSYEAVRSRNYTEPFELKENEKLVIQPGEIILTSSLETVSLSKDFAAIITGRSSIARLGIMIHCCQEFIHPGHCQTIPLQIINLSPHPVQLDLSVPVCQIVFFKLTTTASEKYSDRTDAKYAGEIEPGDSKIYEDIKIDYVKEKNQGRSKFHDKKEKFRKVLGKYITPFIPSIICFLIITPFLTENILDKTWSDILDSFGNISASLIISIVLLILYIFSKRGK